MNRITHIITSECEIHVVRLSRESVRIRFEEKDPHLTDHTDFEIEGHPANISEALATAATVLINLDQILQEPS